MFSPCIKMVPLKFKVKLDNTMTSNVDYYQIHTAFTKKIEVHVKHFKSFKTGLNTNLL